MEITPLKNITVTDAQAIYNLSNQLGYANDLNLLSARLKTIITLEDHAIFVARVDDKIVVGCTV